MKSITKLIAVLFLALIASHSFAASASENSYDAEMSRMQKLSETELFLEDNFADQASVELPGIHCLQAEKSKTEVEAAAGGVTTHRVASNGFTCTYTN
ncbi:hypothetical protein [Pseudomonas savastanoi]|uniref:hypothetical protein n=1 Tax=Pseudomonas savastanoi TaxID=29438 RepID=UPI000EFF955D|nr:hypothetical protein [Pseudomonas savastanoi]RMM57876.1 hypothetical protein ALQ75_200213 [Pseudomonas savastanoi pv. glycinea]